MRVKGRVGSVVRVRVRVTVLSVFIFHCTPLKVL